MGRLRTIVALAALAAAAAGGSALAAKPPKPGPATLSINTSASRVTFGGAVTTFGTLTGTGAANAPLTLQQAPFPYTRYTNLATGRTNASGAYVFGGIHPGLNTRYRVKAKHVTSANKLVFVRYRVSLSVSDSTPKRGQRVRFSGERVRLGQCGQQRLIFERVNPDPMSPGRRRRLHHHRRRKLMRSDAPQRIRSHLLLQTETQIWLLGLERFREARHRGATEGPVADPHRGVYRLRRTPCVGDRPVNLSERLIDSAVLIGGESEVAAKRTIRERRRLTDQISSVVNPPQPDGAEGARI